MLVKESSLSVATPHANSRWPAAEIEELGALLQRERNGYGTTKIRHSGDRDAYIAHNVRNEICTWFYSIVDHFTFDREVVGVALNYFDRYMFQQTSDVFKSGDEIQLVATTSIYLAIKLHSMGEKRARALQNLSSGPFEAKRVSAMEAKLLETLDWKLNPPTMHQFAVYYAMLHPLGKFCAHSTHLYEVACHQVDLVVFFPRLLEKFKPSVLAYAAILNASEEVSPRVLSSELKEQWLSLMSHSLVQMDPAHVKEAQTALVDVCPQLPDMACYEILGKGSPRREDPRQSREDSPTNITRY